MTDSPGTQDLLDKTRRGLAWLRRSHYAWDSEKPSRHSEEEFGRILDETASLEAVLRSLGYEGCILGDQGPCNDDAVITCDHCAGIPGPPAPGSLRPPAPETNGSQQLTLFQTYRGHP
ncbi:MAG: hypothetical protein ACE5Q6_07625 [Dehalococcoidia bacterium]